jgi:hypothetical protein
MVTLVTTLRQLHDFPGQWCGRFGTRWCGADEGSWWGSMHDLSHETELVPGGVVLNSRLDACEKLEANICRVKLGGKGWW